MDCIRTADDMTVAELVDCIRKFTDLCEVLHVAERNMRHKGSYHIGPRGPGIPTASLLNGTALHALEERPR